ncbi:bifunctional 3-(3-hydroxy-phenyl)propionate/3-hydroxycinnamic acid hydroxylase [Streptomyces fuscichromogenes]|uniref:3-(3-hydroxy-phenyl)propionate/3-hydroxycinnamic acid hydroxylase n=1 Tax=Streptomyces fuscichromogenes TaxID=1324013 RepID=A0A917XH41_9ACTN|nr:bifunctional 3-(3-hydroxy-phenyl)propionate/3-hydroxycinnamic acid hydroxylase [Streptomyces fuscichromogenes]GGN22834.1 3-(3-hydroxy-phenyl)propionate/3-hydroxycinnamic acid hydroxylase [Streptomyces fuscichromogenes]
MTEPTPGTGPLPAQDRAQAPAADGPAVLIVGAGPVGLTAAHLLGSLGVRVLLVERNATTSDAAKAISLDDESLRTLQSAGLATAVYPIIVPGTGTKYFGVAGRPLVHARGSGDRRFGHPFKNPFAQPDLERVLRAELVRHPDVEARFGTGLTDLTQLPHGVRVTLRPDGGRDTEELTVGYVLGCDGGRSTVRRLLSVPMRGHSFPDDVWLVLDTLDDPHRERYGMHIGDPSRPTVIVPGRDGRCRYEFLLRPGEGAAGQEPAFDLVRRLLRPYREITPEQVERAVAYSFHALLAERLRVGRCFLLGDAAHMMPPFAGQGLNSGIRDAANLCWKLAEVLAERADDSLLDTYDLERRPHAQAVIDLSVRLGRTVMTTSRPRAHLRDLLVRAALLTGPGRRYFTEMRYRPDTRVRTGAVVRPEKRAHPLVGTLLPQPHVLHGPGYRLIPLDDVLGTGWSLLGVGLTEAEWTSARQAGLPCATEVEVVTGDLTLDRGTGRPGITDADGSLRAFLQDLAGHFVLVRPDRVVAAVFAPHRAAQAGQELRRFAFAPAADPPLPAFASGSHADTGIEGVTR